MGWEEEGGEVVLILLVCVVLVLGRGIGGG